MIIIQRIGFLHLKDFRGPLVVVLLRKLLKNSAKDLLQISYDAGVDHDVLVDLCRVHIDLQDLRVFRKRTGVSGDPVAEACSQDNKKITFADTQIGGLGSVHSKHACIQGIGPVKSTLSHQAVAYRAVHTMGQLPDFTPGSGNDPASADKDIGLLCRADHTDGILNIVFANTACLTVDRGRSPALELVFCGGHVLRDIHKNGSGPAALGNVKCPPDGVRKVFDVLYDDTVLCTGHDDARNINLLE